MAWVKQTNRWVIEVVLRQDNVQQFAILPRLWVVERTFG
jgi:transposase